MTGGSAPGPLQRHFLALVPDVATRDVLARLPVPDGARSVHPDDLHLTLAFLGSLDEAGEARALAVAAGAVAAGAARGPVTVRLHRLEVWPVPGILCAAIAAEEGPDPVALLAAAVAAALADSGFPPPREVFHSHVTLARKVPRAAAGIAPLPAPVSWVATGLVLLATRGGSVPRYVHRGRVALTA
jgi:2'-5' RNA ligase